MQCHQIGTSKQNKYNVKNSQRDFCYQNKHGIQYTRREDSIQD